MSDQATAAIETGTIYFVTLALASQVYVMGGGIGLTDYLNLFCWGDTPEEAEENAKAYLLGAGIGCWRSSRTDPPGSRNTDPPPGYPKVPASVDSV